MFPPSLQWWIDNDENIIRRMMERFPKLRALGIRAPGVYYRTACGVSVPIYIYKCTYILPKAGMALAWYRIVISYNIALIFSFRIRML